MSALELLTPTASETPYSTVESRQAVARTIARFTEGMQAKTLSADIISWTDLSGILSDEDFSVIRDLMAIDPRDYGFTGSFVDDGHQAARHADFMVIEDQRYVMDGKERKLSPKFLPPHVYSAFSQLNQAIQIDGYQPLLIESGYRSPAYQAVLFLKFLSRPKDKSGYDFNIAEAAKRVAFPGYSEHGSSDQTAIDVTTPSFLVKESTKAVSAVEFDMTDEFLWMEKNAADFGFYLSYSKDNQAGIQYEPWHWRYLGNAGRDALTSN